MTHHLGPGKGFPGKLSAAYFRLFTRYYTTRNTALSSRNESTTLCSSDAKLIYREEQQPFWNVRGVQSKHGTFANYDRSFLDTLSNSILMVEKLYTASILTLFIIVLHSIFLLKLFKTTYATSDNSSLPHLHDTHKIPKKNTQNT